MAFKFRFNSPSNDRQSTQVWFNFLISSILRDISGSLQCLPFAQLHNCRSLKLHSVVFAPRWRLRCAHCWTLHTAQSGFEIGICNSASLPIYKSSVDSTLWRQCASLPIYKSWLRREAYHAPRQRVDSRMKSLGLGWKYQLSEGAAYHTDLSFSRRWGQWRYLHWGGSKA